MGKSSKISYSRYIIPFAYIFKRFVQKYIFCYNFIYLKIYKMQTAAQECFLHTSRYLFGDLNKLNYK